MKIAIMTQPLGKNYGGIMQAWALQQVLKRMGHEVVTLDRQFDRKGPLYAIARLGYRASMKIIGQYKLPINIEKHLPHILKNTRHFLAQHLTMSEPLDSVENLKAHVECEQYDAVIVGSDQTWRPMYSPNIENFFLDFLEDKETRRIAYASSFGVDNWEFTTTQTKRCSDLAKQFDAISVREDSGISLCQQYLGVDAKHVLDPTLLLKKEDYWQLIGSERLKDTPEGLYTYFLDQAPEKLILAQTIGEDLGEQVYACQAKYGIDPKKSRNLDDFALPDVRDWLAGFANAKCILTNSFHGMIFSLIFEKDFLVIGNKSRGLGRFLSLLEALDLQHLLLDETADVQRPIQLAKLDWLKINKRINEMTENSKQYLRLSLS